MATYRREKILANYISEKGLIFTIYRVLLKLKKPNNLIQK